MKKLLLVLALGLFTLTVNAQDVKKVTLEQTVGEFTVKELKLSEGDYIFEVENNGVDHAVGLVIAPEGKTDAENHIKAAYVKTTPKNGESSETNVVTLTKGAYVYFCPLNPTIEYKLTVE
jgi:plastocyanin